MSDDVIPLCPRAQRDADAEAQYVEAAHQEALGMIERAGELVREHRAVGVAVVFVLADGGYCRMLPYVSYNTAALIGAMATAQHHLIAAVEDEEGDE